MDKYQRSEIKHGERYAGTIECQDLITDLEKAEATITDLESKIALNKATLNQYRKSSNAAEERVRKLYALLSNCQINIERAISGDLSETNAAQMLKALQEALAIRPEG